MRITVYKCDECKKTLSDETTKKEHISIHLQGDSGVVAPSEANIDRWSFKTKRVGIFQFCNTKCLSKFFDKKRPEVINSKNY